MSDKLKQTASDPHLIRTHFSLLQDLFLSKGQGHLLHPVKGPVWIQWCLQITDFHEPHWQITQSGWSNRQQNPRSSCHGIHHASFNPTMHSSSKLEKEWRRQAVKDCVQPLLFSSFLALLSLRLTTLDEPAVSGLKYFYLSLTHNYSTSFGNTLTCGESIPTLTKRK